MRTVKMYVSDVRENDELADRRGQSPGRVFRRPRMLSPTEVEIQTSTGGTEYARTFKTGRMVWVEIP